MSQLHQKQLAQRQADAEMAKSREARAKLPERPLIERREELRVDADDASAVKAARAETVKQVAQELVGVGRGFRAAPIVITTRTLSDAAIDPVTKLPISARLASEKVTRESIERVRLSMASEHSSEEQAIGPIDPELAERIRQKSKGDISVESSSASQSDRSTPSLRMSGPLERFRQGFKGEDNRVFLSRTIAGGRESRLAASMGDYAPAVLRGAEQRRPARAVRHDLRQDLLQKEQLFVAAVGIGHEGGNRVVAGDERALFDAELLRTRKERAAQEHQRNLDRQRARIALELGRQQKTFPREPEFRRFHDRIHEFVSTSRWRERFEEMLHLGSEELPRALHFLHLAQRPTSPRLRWLLIGLTVAALVVLIRI